MTHGKSSSFRLYQVVGTSPNSIADAVRQAVEGAGNDLRGMHWFQVDEIRGAIHDGKVSEFQVVVRIGAEGPSSGGSTK